MDTVGDSIENNEDLKENDVKVNVAISFDGTADASGQDGKVGKFFIFFLSLSLSLSLSLFSSSSSSFFADTLILMFV